MKFRTSIVTAAVAAASISIAGCGSGGGYSSGMNQSTGGGGAANVVSIVDYAFSPQSLSVKVGTTVTWTNTGSVAHTSTSDTGMWNSGQLAGATAGGPYGGGSAGASYSFAFQTAGTYTYHCANHTNMTGTITVTP